MIRNLNAFFFGKPTLIIVALLSMLTGFAVNAQTGRVVETDTHRFTEYADGVWAVAGNGSIQTMSNAMVLVGEFDTLVVDSHVTPAAARALLASLPAITDKPVRYLVNTHYHFDHAHGNQVFPREVEIIGHSFTRDKLSGEHGNVLDEATFHAYTDGVPATVANLEKQAAAETDPTRKAQLQERYRVQRDYMEALKEIVPTPPNITMETKMTLFQVVARGSREIQILHLGLAHTAGDVVIYLPQEKIVFTGDMLVSSFGSLNMADAYVNDWPATLEAVKQLDFDWVLPGHGQPFQDRQMIDDMQSYLRDVWDKTVALKAQGMSAEQVAESIDLTNHADAFPQIRGPGVNIRAVTRIYELLDQ